MKDRRIVALELSRKRRERLDATLRASLDAQRRDHAAQLAQCDAWRERVEQDAAALQCCNDQLDAMACGMEAFSLTAFNSCRSYLEIVADRHRASVAELGRQVTAADLCAATVARTQREIAVNEIRSGLLKDRAHAIGAELDRIASDDDDDEAQEIATARLIRERGAAA
jgi:hypothetical protein